MAASAFVIHDKFKEYLGDGTIDMDADVFKIRLYQSISNCATTTVDGIAAATNEVTTGGYVEATLASVTWVESAGTVTFDCADVVWTASGGPIAARFCVIYDDTVTTPVADPIVCHGQLDAADVTATDGNTLTITMPATGIFTLT